VQKVGRGKVKLITDFLRCLIETMPARCQAVKTVLSGAVADRSELRDVWVFLWLP
jgi:hypothetical protein